MSKMSPKSRGWMRKFKLWPVFLTHRRKISLTSPFANTLKLREYQEECIEAVLSSLKQGHKRLGISLATGSGKTVVFTQLIDRIKSRGKKGTQTLILAHRQELVEQAARHCSNTYPEKTVEIEMGSLNASGFADITVASIQSITSGSRISKFDPNRFKLVLVDEAHHIVASSYMKTLNYFGVSKLQDNSPILLGVSATLSRTDGLQLKDALDHIVYHKDYIDLIDEKWLSNLIFTTVQTNADISNVKHGINGDFQSGDLSRVVNTKEINNITVRSWLKKCSQRKSTLVFCVDTCHVVDLTNTFREHGIDAYFITGNTPKQERSEKLDDFKAGRIPVLVNCGVFTEGTDIPNIDCVLLTRPTRSRNLLVQMIGRGMRLSPGKENCHIVDMVACFDNGIVTSPTLFGLDPQALLNEDNPNDLMRAKEDEDLKCNSESSYSQEITATSVDVQPASFNGSTKVTFTDYFSVYDLVNDTSGEKHIRMISPNAWVRVSGDRYILSGPRKAHLCLEKNPEMNNFYQVMEHVILENSFGSTPIYTTPRRICLTSDFLNAVQGADTYATKKYPFQLISKSQKWRNSPASNEQIDFLNKIRNADDQLAYGSLSKGKAGDMITKFKHGARGEYSRMVEKRKAKEKSEARQKKKDLKVREKVVVGPLF